jgi:hypothetical protein
MRKVYLLLRNNRQSGPFTIDELWQQQLKPTDMIWVEGKSTAWAYLTEVELLPGEHISEEPPPVSDEIEERAEALRRQALAYHPPVKKPAFNNEWTEKEINEDKEEEIVLVDHRKDKRSVVGELMMTALIIVLFAGGIYGSKTLFQSRKSTAATQAIKVVSNDEHAAVRPVHQEENIQPAAIIDSTSLVDSMSHAIVQHEIASIHKKEAKKDSVKVIPPIVTVPQETNVPTALVDPLRDVHPAKKDSQAVTQTSPVMEEKPEKRKGLGAALKGLFKKKNRDKQVNTEADSTVSH